MDQNILYFTNKSEWRNWLAENHNQTEPVWLLFYKKNKGLPSLDYNDVVEQALCFGWIDGIIKGINDESYMRKLMPRTNFFNWSETNRRRVQKLIETKEMTEIGLAKIGNYASTGKLIWPEIKPENHTEFSKNLFEILKSDQLAFTHYSNLTQVHKVKYIQWVMSAKKEETQKRRMSEAVQLLRKNTKNLLK